MKNKKQSESRGESVPEFQITAPDGAPFVPDSQDDQRSESSECAETQGGASLKFVEPKEGIKRVYANHIQISQTPDDIRVLFGELIHVSEQGVITIEDRAAITMAWSEAKRAVQFLQSVISAFEKQNGAIRTPTLPQIPTTLPDIDSDEVKLQAGTFLAVGQLH